MSAKRSLAPGGAPPLATRELSWGYGSTLLGRELSLRLEPGQAVALVGPNGSGKSTLIKTLAGLLPPLSGEVLLRGQRGDALPPPERARLVAVLGQEGGADSALTVRELVELGRTAHLGTWGTLDTEDRQAVEQALSSCNLQELAERRLDRLSGGELQRARIALTVAQQAPLLLLDEPTNHLDLRRRHELCQLLAQLRQKQQLAILMVLHDLAEAYREADRVLVLSDQHAEEIPATAPDRRARLAQAFGVPLEHIVL